MTPVSELPSHETLADSDLLKDLYTDWSEIMATTAGMTTRLLRSIFDELHQSTKEPENVSYKEEAVGAVAGSWAPPKDADTSRVLLYTHGGGFAAIADETIRKIDDWYGSYMHISTRRIEPKACVICIALVAITTSS
ncbi:hypothetical protein AB0O52_18615 [Arthrobacter sp. NPDC080073]|uniref:hypothetical protein n=1 Tax=Arthrobacter sp. NPDC080073 TaxID=3155919 RepID=UPI003423D204